MKPTSSTPSSSSARKPDYRPAYKFADKPLGVALIGCGIIGETHAKAVQESEGMRLSCVFSRNNDKTNAFARKFNTPAAPDLTAAVGAEDVDLVIVATASGSHATIAEAALGAGKHVLLEKPLTMTTAEANPCLPRLKRKTWCCPSFLNDGSSPSISNSVSGYKTANLGAFFWPRSHVCTFGRKPTTTWRPGAGP